MPVIRQLDPHVADLIAAGEVVERPFPSGWSRRGPKRFILRGGSEFRLAPRFLRSENACTPDFRREAGRS